MRHAKRRARNGIRVCYGKQLYNSLPQYCMTNKQLTHTHTLETNNKHTFCDMTHGSEGLLITGSADGKS